MTVGQLLRDKAEFLGYTQRQLADQTNISESTISSYLWGNKTPSIKNFTKLAMLLEIDLNILKEIEL